MKKEKISMALNEIDEKYVEEAANYKKKKMTAPIMKWCALAASLAIVVAGTAIAMPHLTTGTEPELSGSTPTENVIVTQNRETAIETIPTSSRPIDTTTTYHFESDSTEGTGYFTSYLARIIEGRYQNYAPMRAFLLAEAPVGEKLEDTTVYGFWNDTDKGYFDADDYTGAEEIETLRAEVYAIKDISPEIAVFVKYLDQGDALTTTHYYVFVNRDVKNEIKTLADFYEIFGAARYFSLDFKDMILETVENGRMTDDIYGMNQTLLNDLHEKLLTLDGTLSERPMEFTRQLTLDAELVSVGSYNGNVGIFDNGYIVFNFHSTNYFSFTFDIGEENAKALIAYVEEYAELKYRDDLFYGAETVTQSFSNETAEMTICTNDPIVYEISGEYIPE